jgi:hypothetical protein
MEKCRNLEEERQKQATIPPMLKSYPTHTT